MITYQLICNINVGMCKVKIICIGVEIRVDIYIYIFRAFGTQRFRKYFLHGNEF